jgi:ribose transport system permease protein
MSLRSSKELHGWNRRLGSIVRRQDVLLAAIFVVMVAVFSAANPRFFSLAAAANILQDFSPVVLMAAGQTFVIASGGIDLFRRFRARALRRRDGARHSHFE